MQTGIPIEDRTPRVALHRAMSFVRSLWPVDQRPDVELGAAVQAFYAWLDSLPTTHDRPWS